MNVRRIQGALLDFWVAKSAGVAFATAQPTGSGLAGGAGAARPFAPSSDWSQGGPIVSEEWFVIEDMLIAWFGPGWADIGAVRTEPLKWFMRAFVASKFGDEVEDIDLKSLAEAEVRLADEGGDPSLLNRPAARGPGAMRFLGAMFGRR